MAYDFDLLTIGAGSGGVAGSRRAASYGARVGIIEAVRVGGTCVLRGCVPKKLLVYGAEFASMFEDAAGFGWTIEGASLDWGRLIAAKDKELDRLNAIYIGMLERAGVQIVEGWGKLADAHTVMVGDRKLTAQTIMIATGGQAVVPEIPGAEHLITSDAALDLKRLPERVVIWGGGYIAVEFAGIFRAAGAEVDIVIRSDKLLTGFDEEVREHLTQALANRGIRIHHGARIERVEPHGAGDLTVHLSDGRRLEAEVALAATGRRPNVAGLGLEAAGVELNRAGAILVDRSSRTTVPNIYAVGDVTDRLALTPVAIGEARALAETLYNKNPMEPDHINVPTAVFSQPPVGTVGMTEAHAREVLGKVDVYTTRFKPMKNTLSGRDERVFMKLIVDPATDRVVGCHMVGPDAPEIIQGMGIALKCGATKRQFDATVGIHPSAAEEFVTMRDKRPEPVAKAAE